MKRDDPMFWALVLTLLTMVAMLMVCHDYVPMEHADSPDYYNLIRQLPQGIPNVMRTPGYGIAWGLCGAWWGLGERAALCVLVGLTALMWLAATGVIGLIARRLGFGRWASAACMVAFGCYPGAMRYVFMVLPEGLAICSCVFLLGALMQLFSRPAIGRVIGVGGWVLWLMLLKPVFLILLPMMLALAGWMAWRREWRTAIAGVATAAVLGAMVWCYTGWWENQYGFRSYSAVNTINNYALVREADVIHAEDFRDHEMLEYFNQLGDYQEGEEFTVFYDFCLDRPERLVDLNQAVNKAMARDKGLAARAALSRFGRVLNMPIVGLLTGSFQTLCAPVKLGFALAFLLLALVLIKRTGAETWQRETVAAATLLALALWVTNWFGAQNDWGRLFIPAWGWTVIAAAAALRACRWNRGAESGRRRRSKESYRC